MKRGSPEPLFAATGGGGSAAMVVRAIVYMSEREALMGGLRESDENLVEEAQPGNATASMGTQGLLTVQYIEKHSW